MGLSRNGKCRIFFYSFPTRQVSCEVSLIKIYRMALASAKVCIWVTSGNDVKAHFKFLSMADDDNGKPAEVQQLFKRQNDMLKWLQFLILLSPGHRSASIVYLVLVYEDSWRHRLATFKKLLIHPQAEASEILVFENAAKLLLPWLVFGLSFYDPAIHWTGENICAAFSKVYWQASSHALLLLHCPENCPCVEFFPLHSWKAILCHYTLRCLALPALDKKLM